ncbi:hypothetical protein KQX54_018294 [Cotesia glomerata]|uniref:Secreted protein n=1 Tax=Cotesia glomerata TaxID=32391 RepID=A0AAV7HYB6_COTGL|nr:hypothetical protein KQX54_018294 [Cotesia glomerata]
MRLLLFLVHPLLCLDILCVRTYCVYQPGFLPLDLHSILVLLLAWPGRLARQFNPWRNTTRFMGLMLLPPPLWETRSIPHGTDFLLGESHPCSM